MVRVIATRVVRLVATLLAVTFLTFTMLEFLPGDPVNAILPPNAVRTPELIAQVRADLNLDDPFFQRYFAWLGDALTGDLGQSYVTDQEGAEISTSRLPITLQLAVMGILLALILAVPIGILGAYKQGKWQDTVTSAGVQVGLSVPNFIFGIFLIWLFAVNLQWLPASNWNRLSDGLVDNLKTAILPASALSARAKGVSNRFILFRHALRPSSLSLMTIVGINFGALLGGTVIIETLFAVPGIGFRLINAINQRDILVIQGITVFIAASYVLINTLVDLLYSALDPRIRRS